jgi:L-asparaginase
MKTNTANSKLLLIYTGGTIGMIRDDEQGTLKAFDFDQLLSKIPEIKLLDHHIDTVSFEKPIDSSDFGIREYQKLAKIIFENYDAYDGFVVLHGSDTMSYTASALSFMLENLSKPIIFTGSQLPIGDLRTDAKENLISSIQVAGLKHNGLQVVKEVGLYFEYKLYRANRTTKANAEQFEAFESPNYPHLIQSGVSLKINHAALKKVRKQKPLVLHSDLEDHILLLKLFPGLDAKIFKSIMNISHLKGIILESFGSGNFKTEPWFIEGIQAKINEGIPVVNITQCIGGQVQMGKYYTSQQLQKVGVISGNDMTTESALAKMMYLLPKRLSLKVFKTIFETSLRGEVSD